MQKGVEKFIKISFGFMHIKVKMRQGNALLQATHNSSVLLLTTK